jgi:hypothetical protein
MKPCTQITLDYIGRRGKPGRLVLIRENLHTFRDSTGRAFGSLAMAMAVHRTGNNITGRSMTMILKA